MMTSSAEIIGTYERPAHGWTCFHCGETFTTPGGARDHFGADPTKEPGCMIRVQLGDERGLLMVLRQAEEQLESYRNEDSETARQFHGMTSKHQTELRQEEERGYARGVADMQKQINTPETEDFMKALPLEAAHQVERWGPEHDAGKAAWDWYWVLGHLSSKAVHSIIKGDAKKAKHHLITSAALLLNWHKKISTPPAKEKDDEK